MTAKARAVSSAVRVAVEAASAADAEQLHAAVVELSKLDSEQIGTVMGDVIRMLLEEQYQDGLDGDDIRAVLEDCARSALPWLPELDPHVLLIVLAGALGIHPGEHEGVTHPGAQAVALHAPVLVADLLRGTGRKLEPYLDAALAEIARAELMEAP